MPKRPSKAFSKRLAKVERELKADKPEVKTLDHMLNPLTAAGTQFITSAGIYNGVASVNYDLTRGFIQGLQNDDGNIDGNYCKLTSMDLRVQLNCAATNAGVPTSRVRLMLVRTPNAETLTPVQIQSQVLEYGDPATYGQLTLVSPLKRNTTINGGYDVMYDRVHTLSSGTANPVNSNKYIHFRKKWKKGLTLRFSGVAGALALEQNRIYLFAFDPDASPVAPVTDGTSISFINRIRFSDE